MKQRINLFKKSNVSKSLTTIKKMTSYGILSSFFLFSIFLLVIFFQFNLELNAQSLHKKRQNLIDTLSSDKTLAAKLTFLARKEDELIQFSKDDAEFLPYYNLLGQLLIPASGEAQIKSMTIDKNKETDFTIQFVNFEPAYSFMKNIESEDFLQHFSSLTLKDFDVVQVENTTFKGYQLHFNGKFNIINDTSL